MDTQVEATARTRWWMVVLIGRNPRRTLVRIAVLVTVSVVVFKFILLPIRVEGISMLPTYRGNRVNFVNRLTYLFHPPQRGDVVAVKLAGPHLMFMKRIVGLPGETVAFHNGQLIINGQAMPEPYMRTPCHWEIEPKQNGPDEYYVVGDNRTMAPWDHEQGRAKRERIFGKVLL